MSKNVAFSYLYRDAGNYKRWHRVVFDNPFELASNEIEYRIRSALDTSELFIADQVRLPEVFTYLSSCPTGQDHCYHEFESVEFTDELPNDNHSRSIKEFLEELEDAARRGWQVFDPVERVSRYLFNTG
jgi:stress-induced morphogen